MLDSLIGCLPASLLGYCLGIVVLFVASFFFPFSFFLKRRPYYLPEIDQNEYLRMRMWFCTSMFVHLFREVYRLDSKSFQQFAQGLLLQLHREETWISSMALPVL